MELNFDQAIAVISTTAIRWEQMARDIPSDLFNRKPNPEEWSALECLVHIIDVENVIYSRLEAFLKGVQTLPAFFPDKEGTRLEKGSLQNVLAADFSAKRDKSIAKLKILKPADLGRKSVHAELGAVTLGQMINEWAAHDLNHTMQAERALMQPFIEGCGPWVVYFNHHRF